MKKKISKSLFKQLSFCNLFSTLGVRKRTLLSRKCKLFSAPILLFYILLSYLLWFESVHAASSVLYVREGTHPGYERLVMEVQQGKSPKAKFYNKGIIVIEGLGPFSKVSHKVLSGKESKVLKKCELLSQGLVLTLKDVGQYQIKRQFLLPAPPQQRSPGSDTGQKEQQQQVMRFVVDLEKRKGAFKETASREINVQKSSAQKNNSHQTVIKILEQKQGVAIRIDDTKQGANSPNKNQNDLSKAIVILKEQNPLPFIPLLLQKPYRPMIVIDAGHGGHDPGSVSCLKRYEKHVTLAAALKIAAELKASGRYHVKLTRQSDVFVPKRQRFDIARKANADFFISIHADNHPDPKMSGLSIYTLSKTATDKEAERLAQRENAAEFVSGFDLDVGDQDVSSILIHLSQKDTKNVSLKIARALQEYIRAENFTKILNLRAADLAVLKAPDTPSLLIELGFLSNKTDEKRVHDVNFQKKVAILVVRALDNHFKETTIR